MRATTGVKQPQGSIRFGLCYMFRDQPIKFGITTATAVLNRCLRFRSRVQPPVLQFSGTESFMALELVPGALDGVTGRVRYPPPFEEMKRSGRTMSARLFLNRLAELFSPSSGSFTARQDGFLSKDHYPAILPLGPSHGESTIPALLEEAAIPDNNDFAIVDIGKNRNVLADLAYLDVSLNPIDRPAVFAGFEK